MWEAIKGTVLGVPMAWLLLHQAPLEQKHAVPLLDTSIRCEHELLLVLFGPAHFRS